MWGLLTFHLYLIGRDQEVLCGRLPNAWWTFTKYFSTCLLLYGGCVWNNAIPYRVNAFAYAAHDGSKNTKISRSLTFLGSSLAIFLCRYCWPSTVPRNLSIVYLFKFSKKKTWGLQINTVTLFIYFVIFNP